MKTYIPKALLALTLAGGLGYFIDKATNGNVYTDTYSTVDRTARGIDLGNLGDVVHEAKVDIQNRNPGDALREFERVNTGYSGPRSGSTPLNDVRLRGSHYKNGHDIWKSYEDSVERLGFEPVPVLGGGLLTLLGLGVIASRKRKKD